MWTNGTSSRAANLALVSRRAGRTSQLLTPHVAALPRSRHHQYRSFWFGAWARDGDDDSWRHARRRHRAHRRRYLESANCKLSWEDKPRHGHVRAVMKTAFAHIARRSTSTPDSKSINVKDVKSWSDELSGGLRPGRNIKHVEREALNHLFSAHKRDDDSCQSPHWSPLNNIRKYLRGTEMEQVSADDVLSATRSAGGTDCARPSGSSQSAPTAEEDSPGEFDDLNSPRQPPTREEASKNDNDLNKYKPVEWNEPDGLPELTPEERSKDYTDLDKYASPDTSSSAAAAEASGPLYNDLDKYKPVEWNEPDGLCAQTPEERSKNYDDLHKYGPVTWDEPDGLRRSTPEELSKNYDDVEKYSGAVEWNEPDGLRKLTPEELSKQYDDLNAYHEPFKAPDALVEAHEAAQQDPTPRAEPITAKVEAPADDPAKNYSDLDQYGPVRWNEPDGLRKLTPEELSKNYEDLHLYSQYDNSGPATPRAHPEEASKQYNDLSGYRAFPNAGPAEERVHPEVATKQYKDLHKYPSAGYEEPGETTHVHPEELTKNYQDLAKYRPHTFDSPDKAYPMHPEESSKAYDDLGFYNPVMHHEPDGKPVEKVDLVASSLGAFDSSVENNTEPQTAAEIRRDVLQRASRNRKPTMTQTAKSQEGQGYAPAHGQGTGSSAERADSSSSRAALTGNYARDFPEEFATSWDTSNSASKSTLFPRSLAGAPPSTLSTSTLGCEKEDAVDFSSMDENFPSEKADMTTRSQPALDRDSGRKPLLSAMDRLERMRLTEGAASKRPQAPELGSMDDGASNTTSPSEQPVSYKMLAYDPSTQSISIAETSSGVHDASSTRATPAEVLLRVSNPSKFFPYLSSLQAEGYEIASGSGDVLVFRKVRPGTASKDVAGSTMNPIDGTGRLGPTATATAGYVHCETPPYKSVHDGQSQDVKEGKKKKKKKKRVFGRKVVTGTALVAGTAWAVSVASEYLSTSGGGF